MPKFVHQWEHDGAVITFSWLADAPVKPDRVYAFAFTADCRLLLVTDPQWAPAGWLPGGGIEVGETPEQALARELAEEANATLHQSAKIGTQVAESSSGARSYHAFYWCRVTLAGLFTPEHEISERHLVPPDQFLDRLFWGRLDPKAPMLLQRALQIEQSYESRNASTTPD